MPQIRRILFPADLSDQCRAVIPHVRAMAGTFHSELVVLNVLEAPPGYYKDWHAYLTLVNWQAIRESREREVSAFVREELKGLPVTQVLEEGEPAYNIVKYAREHSTDLIMMPTQRVWAVPQFAAGLGNRQGSTRLGNPGRDERPWQ